MRRTFFDRSVRLRSLVLVAGASALVSSSVAFATALAITPERLTIYSSASAVGVTTCTLTGAADTYADEAVVNAGRNFGTATTLEVRSEALANKRSFVRFDLSSCSIPTTANVKTAGMKLFLSTAPPASRTYAVHRVTASWGETSLTWNDQPSIASSPTASTATGTTNDVTLEWNVLSDVSAFVAGAATNNGWRIGDASEGGALLTAYQGTFSSREHGTTSERPTLVIRYYP